MSWMEKRGFQYLPRRDAYELDVGAGGGERLIGSSGDQQTSVAGLSAVHKASHCLRASALEFTNNGVPQWRMYVCRFCFLFRFLPQQLISRCAREWATIVMQSAFHHTPRKQPKSLLRSIRSKSETRALLTDEALHRQNVYTYRYVT